MYKMIYIACAAAALSACGLQPRPLTEVTSAIAAPSGTVDAGTAAQIVLDNIDKDNMIDALSTKTTRLPTSYFWQPVGQRLPQTNTQTIPNFFDQACAGVERNRQDKTETFNLTGDMSGTVTLVTSCGENEFFTLLVQYAAACNGTTCFDGFSRFTQENGTMLWSTRAEVKTKGASSGRVIDLGGTVKAAGQPSDIKLIAYYASLDANGKSNGVGKPIVFSWGQSGVGSYSEYYLTGNGPVNFRCNTPDQGKSGCCRQLNNANTPTGEQFTWGGSTCG